MIKIIHETNLWRKIMTMISHDADYLVMIVMTAWWCQWSMVFACICSSMDVDFEFCRISSGIIISCRLSCSFPKFLPEISGRGAIPHCDWASSIPASPRYRTPKPTNPSPTTLAWITHTWWSTRLCCLSFSWIFLQHRSFYLLSWWHFLKKTNDREVCWLFSGAFRFRHAGTLRWLFCEKLELDAFMLWDVPVYDLAPPKKKYIYIYLSASKSMTCYVSMTCYIPLCFKHFQVSRNFLEPQLAQDIPKQNVSNNQSFHKSMKTNTARWSRSSGRFLRPPPRSIPSLDHPAWRPNSFLGFLTRLVLWPL